jgi:flagellar biosynthesis protein FlhF
MKVKTLTGPSIHAALVEARRLLGDDVVLLESIPAEGDSPARITVMVDVPAPAVAQAQAETAAETVNASRRPAYGYAGFAQSKPDAEAVDILETAVKSTAPAVNSSYNGAPPLYRNAALVGVSGTSPTPGVTSPGRNSLYAVSTDAGSNLPVKAEQLQELLEAQLKLIHNRLDRLDRRFAGAIIGAGMRWAAHPLFTKLLQQGMRPASITKFFENLVAKGFEPNDDPQKIRWALAHEIRNALQRATPKRYTGTMMFIGPSGAGKTSLLLKAATHPSFLARRKTTIISILPEDDEYVAYQNPAELFTRFGIAVQTARGIEEMNEALDRSRSFDQILIDTPPMPVHEAGARKMLLYLKRLVEPLMPLQVHLVLNATRALEDFDLSYINRLPLRADAIAFTHLDETKSLGRIAEWMMQTSLPVQFASSSPKVPEGVGAFTPSWFVEEMMRIL